MREKKPNDQASDNDQQPGNEEGMRSSSDDELKTEHAGVEEEIALILKRIQEKERELEDLKKRRAVLVERQYAESKPLAPDVGIQRSRDISKILRLNREPGSDAVSGQLRQMRDQMRHIMTRQALKDGQ